MGADLLDFDDRDTDVDSEAARQAADAAIEQATMQQLRRRVEDLENLNDTKAHRITQLEHENAQLKLELRKRLPQPAIEK